MAETAARYKSRLVFTFVLETTGSATVSPNFGIGILRPECLFSIAALYYMMSLSTTV